LGELQEHLVANGALLFDFDNIADENIAARPGRGRVRLSAHADALGHAHVMPQALLAVGRFSRRHDGVSANQAFAYCGPTPLHPEPSSSKSFERSVQRGPGLGGCPRHQNNTNAGHMPRRSSNQTNLDCNQRLPPLIMSPGLAALAGNLTAEVLRLGLAEEEVDPDPAATQFKNAYCITLILTFLIGMTVIFECGKDHVLETASPTIQPILQTMFSGTALIVRQIREHALTFPHLPELTVLGFLALVSFFIAKGGILVNISVQVYGSDPENAEKLGETFEVHFVGSNVSSGCLVRGSLRFMWCERFFCS
jgi:hypothetical protein